MSSRGLGDVYKRQAFLSFPPLLLLHMDQEQRQLHHPPRPAGVFAQAVKPFQAVVGPEFRGPLHHPGEDVQASPQAAEEAGPGGLAVLRHPELLLGGPQADEDAVRAAPPDGLRHGAVLFKIAVVGPGDF